MPISFGRLFVVALICIGVSSVFALPAGAGTTGAIQGYITDDSGRVLAGVSVTAASPSGHFTTTSGSGGFYSFNGLPLDTYTLTFTKDGYQGTSIPGVSTVQDQPNRVNTHLSTAVKTIGRVAVRGQTSLVQPTVTANTYVINQQRLSDLNGTPQDLNAFNAFNSLPGVTPDSFGFPTIRGGAENDVGYQIDGVDNTEIGTGEYLNALTLNGARSVQLSTGGYDVSNGNTNSGVINEVIKRGTYPGEGQATFRIGSPVFNHELSFDYGNATPNNRFSYYISFGGSRTASAYGDRSTLLPLDIGQSEFSSINDNILNLFYHFGQDNKNELQFLTNLSGQSINFNYLAFPPAAPYASNNGNVQASSDPFGFSSGGLVVPSGFALPQMFQSNYITLFPGQAAYQQNTNVADTQTFNSVIDKLNFKRQLTPSSFAEVRLTKTYLNWVDWYPWDLGSFSDTFFNENAIALGEGFDYTNQVSPKNELGAGGEGIYYHTQYWQNFPSFEPFDEPLEDLGCPNAFATGGGCYIAPFNAALNAANAANGGTLLSGPLPTDPGHAPLSTYVDNASYANDPVHRWDLWVKDRWQPNQRLTVTVGLRWDKESIAIPPNAAQLNTTYFFDDNGNLVTVPGQSIGTDVTQPQQISPRVAAAYEATPRDTVRFSYGKNIEFAPLAALENTYQVPTSLQSCSLASGCFVPLPGGPTRTTPGVTNNITNLYQQVVLDLTTNNFAQYTPLLPQTATSVDFSYEHEFPLGLEMRITPYYRKGTNYFVGNQPLLFLLPSGKPVFGPLKEQNAGINVNTGVEFALQRSATYGFSGLIDATYDNTLANYDSDFFPTVNAAALAAGHFFHVTYVAPVSGTFNLVYNTRRGFHAATTISYESGYRYGVGKKTFVFAANGQTEEVLNTDLASTPSQAYYFTDPTNPGTMENPNITGSRGTNEGNDPGTLFGPPIAIVNVTISHDLGKGAHNAEAGIRVQNLLGNYSPQGAAGANIPANLYYVNQGIGGYGPGSGFNPNQCAPGQVLACEPFQYNQTAFPYEAEPTGPPRLYTFFLSVKY